MDTLEAIEINEDRLDEYVVDAKDASFFTGLSYFCSKDKTDKDFSRSSFMAFTLLPSPFLRNEFEYAVNIQKDWNYLIHHCSNNIDLIYECLKDVIKTDEFIAKHWNICQIVNKEGINQPITLNIMRSDYFLDENKLADSGNNKTALSQIELNTFGCGGCATSSRIIDMHKYMLHKTDNDHYIEKVEQNNIYKSVVDSLIYAWKLYDNPNAHIVLVVRNTKYNYGDHRLLEYKIFELEPRIKFLRLTFTDIYKKGRLDDKMRLFIENDEIGLVYFKSGFNPSDYPTEDEWNARLLIERSKAIKAPKIEFQLLNTKKFQQCLFEQDIIEKFIEDKDVVNSLRATFVKQFSFNKEENNSDLIDLMRNDYENWVLKPQREGGGNNIYGVEIKDLADKVGKEKDFQNFILMERIRPFEHSNYIVHPSKITEKIKLHSELGIFGITVGDSSGQIFYNEFAGYLLKSKDIKQNEGGIISGSGAFDSIFFN